MNLAEWAKAWKAEHLDSETRLMIGYALNDLYYGPNGDGPGFQTACERISAALDALPSQVWLDTQSDDWTDSEPVWVDAIDHSPDDCEVWNCDCTVARYPEDVESHDRAALIRAIVGRDLAEYVQ